MFDYVATAADATALLAEFGSQLTLKRFNRGAFNPVTSTIGTVTYSTQQVKAVILPFKSRGVQGLSDSLTEALRKGKLRTVLIGASNLDFEPESLDVLFVGTETFILQSISPLAPAGTSVLYTSIAEKSGLSAADLAATLAP